MNKQLSDILTIHHQALNVFPYWTDDLIDLWETSIIGLFKDIQQGLPNKEFYKKLKKLSALLNDGHTMIFLPDEIKKNLTYAPLTLTVIENELVIYSAHKDFTSYLFEPIKKINTLTVNEFLNKITNHYWKHNINISLTMAQKNFSFIFNTSLFLIEFKNGKKMTFPFLPNQMNDSSNYTEKFNNYLTLTEHEAISIYQVSNKIIINLKHFMSDEMVAIFYKYIPEYLACEEIIFDLRNNSGGNSGYGNEITQAFFNSTFETEKISTQAIEGGYIASAIILNTDNYNSKNETDPELIKMNQMLHHQYLTSHIETNHYKKYEGLLKNKSVKILQNDQTYSAAENFIINFSNADRATLIGSNTAGSTGQPALFKLKTGGCFVVTAKKVETPNGLAHHNIGIKPDIFIHDTLVDNRQRQDNTLIYALKN
ncbi:MULTISPECIES: S41 family peptidase [Vagococcus]|uniref:Peptidase, S41 family n=1 Tax=Vagococcus fluvialis bH819 TaxID=1255619 RepID=A0A1X6WKH0_9ENTE|nr:MULTISPECIES: S41 family peptidase [Vagococcus]SLM84765.1 Peptidase, S41 family [Vagococcus fluvialis bH819]